MFCTSCGSAQNDEAKFCTNCGALVVSAARAPRITIAPTVPASAPEQQPQAETAPSRFPWGIVAVVTVLMLLGFAALSVAVGRGMFGDASNRTTSKTAAEKSSDNSVSLGVVNESEPPEGDPALEQPSGLSPQASYSELQRLYEDVGYLSSKLGVAFTDGTYGGTGFAYEVFNPSIGSNERAVRATLVDKTAAMLTEIESSLASARELQVASEYQTDYEGILALYELLEARAAVLHDTAVVALDSPDESVWRSTLSPWSTQYREQFEVAYPPAEPVQR